LHYVDDTEPGYTRRRHGRGFTYLDESGRTITDSDVVDRLRRLAVPPAWTDVWFCVDPDGHLQATGRDSKQRKQYRYHDDWQLVRDEVKFDSLADFGRALPVLRSTVDSDMGRHTLSFERVVATTVWLLDHTLIRIGNSEYERSGGSYGLTTLRDRHVDIAASTLRFRFAGKSGTPHDVVLHDRRVARTVSRCQELPGQRLLQYVDDGSVHAIDSGDVNDYIREITSTDFTAKTFRTWGASAVAAAELLDAGPPDSESAARHQIRDAICIAAKDLRNSPTVCRTSYIHPEVLEAHRDGRLHRPDGKRPSAKMARWMTPVERRLLAVLDDAAPARKPAINGHRRR